jgi:predicted outer membrane repeat protein
MLRKSCFLAAVGVVLMAASAYGAGAFGKRVAIGGAASDLALDETRGVLYIANFTANRIEVMSLATNTIQTSINVAAQPSSISISPDGRWLLVSHFGNRTAPASQANALTLIDLSNNNAKQTFALGSAPLGVAFGLDNKALVVTTVEFILFDPAFGTTQVLDTVQNIASQAVAAEELPVELAKFPPEITAASVAVSGDGLKVYGMGSSSGTFTFRYNVATHSVSGGGIVLASGILGPRVVSLNHDGSLVMAGWVMLNSQGTIINEIQRNSNEFSVGTTAFDNRRSLLYAHIPQKEKETQSVLQVMDADNMTVRDRLLLPEKTSGKSVMNADASVMYSASLSGVLVLRWRSPRAWRCPRPAWRSGATSATATWPRRP